MKTRDERQFDAVSTQPRPAAAAWQPRGKFTHARPLASLVPSITQKSFEKHGFAAASLITDWARIVGADKARDTRPLSLKWPRAANASSEASEESGGRPGAPLVLQVDPAIALDIQYQGAQLIERINTYFGYRAVTQLKLVQEPITPAEKSDDAHCLARAAAVTTPPAPADDAGTSPQPDDPLAAALARLGATIRAEHNRG